MTIFATIITIEFCALLTVMYIKAFDTILTFKQEIFRNLSCRYCFLNNRNKGKINFLLNQNKKLFLFKIRIFYFKYKMFFLQNTNFLFQIRNCFISKYKNVSIQNKKLFFAILGVKVVEWPPHKEVEDMEGKRLKKK